MKIPIIATLMLLASLTGLSQKDSIIHSQPSTDSIVKPKQYVLVLTQDDVAQLFSLIRTSGRYTGAELETYIQSILARLTLVEPPKKSHK